MNYNVCYQDITIIDNKNTVEKIKSTLISIMNLTDEEATAISSLQTNKDLLKLLDSPEFYFSNDEKIKEFNDLKELLDLFGGIYYA